MGLFDEVTGGISDVAGKAADIGKQAAREAKVFAGGANRIIGAPTVGTVKGALSGDPGDIAKVGVAAASIIPAERGLRALGYAREAKGLPLAERLGLGARAALESSPLFHGTTSAAAELIRAGGFSAARTAAEGTVSDMTYATTSARTAAKYARSSAILSGDEAMKPAIVLARKVGEPLAQRQWPGKLGTELAFKSQDVKAVSSFPDSVANMARRVKGQVMGAISAQSGASLAEKLAATKEEIVRLGGTPPTGPFAGATQAKISAVQGELADLPKRATAAADVKSKFENSRISDFAKKAAQKALQGGEQGSMQLGGADEAAKKASARLRGLAFQQKLGPNSSFTKAELSSRQHAGRGWSMPPSAELDKHLRSLKETAKLHAARFSQN